MYIHVYICIYVNVHVYKEAWATEVCLTSKYRFKQRPEGQRYRGKGS